MRWPRVFRKRNVEPVVSLDADYTAALDAARKQLLSQSKMTMGAASELLDLVKERQAAREGDSSV